MLAKIIICGQPFFMHVVICYVNQRIIGLPSDCCAVSDLYNNIYTNNTIMLFFYFFKGYPLITYTNKSKLGAIQIVEA